MLACLSASSSSAQQSMACWCSQYTAATNMRPHYIMCIYTLSHTLPHRRQPLSASSNHMHPALARAHSHLASSVKDYIGFCVIMRYAVGAIRPTNTHAARFGKSQGAGLMLC